MAIADDVIVRRGIDWGNIWGGKVADRDLRFALYVTLGGLALCLILYGVFSTMIWPIIALTFLFGFVGFATVPPLQMDVLGRAAEAPTLASAMNIAAFNLGNAVGAGAGGLVVEAEWGLEFIPYVSAIFAILGIGVVYLNAPKSRARRMKAQHAAH